MPDQEKKEWLIVFLIYVDFRKKSGFEMDQRTQSEMNSLFGDLRNVEINDGVKIVIIINRIRYWKKNKPDDNLPELKDETFIFNVVKNTEKRNKISLFDKVDNKEIASNSTGLQDEINLTNIFKKIYSVPDNKAEHIFLVTWDHGSVFGIFKEEEIKPEKLTPIHEIKEDSFSELVSFFSENENANLFEINKSSAQLAPETQKHDTYVVKDKKFSLVTDSGSNFIKSFEKSIRNIADVSNEIKFLSSNESQFIQYDLHRGSNGFHELKGLINDTESTGHMNNIVENDENKIRVILPIKDDFKILTNKELAIAIQEGFDNQIVDVLLMMNCWMMNLDTLYSMRDKVNILVAPTGDISEPGYNYREIIAGIDKSKSVDEVAMLPLKTLKSNVYNNSFRTEHIQNIDSWHISGMSTERVVNITNAISKIAKEISDYLEVISDRSEKLRVACFFINARKYCFTFNTSADYHLIDIIHWLQNLMYNNFNEITVLPTSDDLFKSIETTISDLRRLISQITFNHPVSGKDIYKGNNGRGKVLGVGYEPTGLSLYLPENVRLQLEKSPNRNLIMDSLIINEYPNWVKLLNDLNAIINQLP